MERRRSFSRQARFLPDRKGVAQAEADALFFAMPAADVSLRYDAMSAKYNILGLYRDPNDPRLVVPKRIPAMGWTINLGHRFGPATLLLLMFVVAAIVIVAAYNH